MRKSNTLFALSTAMMVIASTALVATPALAEGSWNSSISGALTGFNSRSWQDSHHDARHTTARFSGCASPQAKYAHATLELYDEMGWLPDQSKGTRTARCRGTYDWGTMTRPDRYHWTITRINGHSRGLSMSASSVVTTY